MIIDIHRHFVAKEWYSENFWKGYARMVQQITSRQGMPFSIESVQTEIFPRYFDTGGEKHTDA